MTTFLSSIRVVLLCTFSLLSTLSFSQLASGLYHQRFAGVHGVSINPAAGLQGDLSWDINLASANLFVKNDYAHINKTSWISLLRNRDRLQLSPPPEQLIDSSALYLSYDQHASRSHTGQADATIMGPSAWVSRRGIGLGIMTSYRINGYANLPATLGRANYQALMIDSTITIPEITANAAAWAEYALSLSTDRILEDQSVSIGINAKLLRPKEAIGVQTNGQEQYTRLPDGQIAIDSAVMSLYTTSGIQSNSPALRSSVGIGWAVDIGISYQQDYTRIGVAIRDIGRMTMRDGAAMHRWVVNDPALLQSNTLDDSDSVNGLISSLDRQLGLDSSIVSDRFRMYAPTSLHVTYDYDMGNDTYIGAQWRHPIVIDRASLRATPVLAVSYRKEKRWWSVTGTASITDYSTLSLGVGARLGILTVGTDDLISMVVPSKLNRGSIYAAVKINPFSFGSAGYKVRCPKVKRSPFDSAQTVKGARRMGVHNRQN